MPDSTSDLGRCLAESAARAQYSELPDAAVEAAKKSLLDTLAVMLGASGTEAAADGILELVGEMGGRPEATVIGSGDKVPAAMAAFANGALAHCLDYDDQTPWGQHASMSVIPAALAVAERRTPVSGEDLITAIAVGQDMFARLRRNVGWRKDWNLSTILGVFASTATAGRLLGLSADQMMSALGIASMQSAGVMEPVWATGSDLHGIYAGFPAKGAVLAALLAERGTTGVEALFEGEHGFFASYFRGDYDRAQILDGLGSDYQGAGTLYKLWPAVGTSHSHIHAAISLAEEHALASDDIAEIRVHVGDHHASMCTPLEARRAPKTRLDAKFSLPYIVAVALVRRTVELSDFSTASLQDTQVLDVAKKIVPVEDTSLDWKLDLPAGRVEILTRDGKRLAKVGTKVPGNSEAPLTWDDLARKFDACADVAAVPLTVNQVREVKGLVRTLEDLDDAGAVMRTMQAVR